MGHKSHKARTIHLQSSTYVSSGMVERAQRIGNSAIEAASIKPQAISNRGREALQATGNMSTQSFVAQLAQFQILYIHFPIPEKKQ